jgi:hypothetical protein
MSGEIADRLGYSSGALDGNPKTFELYWYAMSAYGMACNWAQAAAGKKAASTTVQLHRAMR